MTPYPVNMDIRPEATGFFDPATNTISYVVKDPASIVCSVVDLVMNIDYAAGRITYDHADHLSAAPYVQQALARRRSLPSPPCRSNARARRRRPCICRAMPDTGRASSRTSTSSS